MTSVCALYCRTGVSALLLLAKQWASVSAISREGCQIKAKHLYRHMCVCFMSRCQQEHFTFHICQATEHTYREYTYIYAHIGFLGVTFEPSFVSFAVFFMQISLQSVGFFPRLPLLLFA